jgi:LmbE family N-acetylglucosaminyl deacetylase
MDLVEAAAQAGSITTSIATARFLEQKEHAWRCYQSQVRDMSLLLKLPRLVRQRLVGTEHFTRVVPPWPEGQPREQDLCADL